MDDPPEKSPGSNKKRVRFSDEHQVLLFDSDSAKKRSRGYAAAEVEQLEGEIGAVCIAHDGTAAAAAAARRATRRRQALLDLFDGDALPGGGEDWDYDAADWDEEPVVRFNDSGIPFEPFHLHQERDEGYFDVETGSYVHYPTALEEADAWVDSLPEMELAPDPALMHTIFTKAAGRDGGKGEAEHDLSPAQIRQYKEQIVGALRPGENVLQALRRLGRSRLPAPVPPAGQSGAAPALPPSGSAQLGDDAEIPGPSQPVRRRIAPPPAPTVAATGAMSAAVKEEFDRLTEWSSLLMEAGEYEIHSTSREDIVHGLAGRAPAAAAAAAVVPPVAIAPAGPGAPANTPALAMHLLQGAATRAALDVNGGGEATLPGSPTPAASPAAAAVEEDRDMFAASDEEDGDENAAPSHAQQAQQALLDRSVAV